MRKFLKLPLAVCLAFVPLVNPLASGQEKPNIVYIISDDVGWKDVGFHDAADIKTPNLDKLAAEGARLEQFYVQPMCTPTRAALMTGRYPMRYGLQTMVIPTKGTYGLAMDEWLLPQALKSAGYDTAMVGKWHLGHADQKYWPKQRGFDYFYGAVIGEIDYYTHSSHGVVDWQRNNKIVKEPGYSTQLLGADAVKVIEKHDTKKPLFLYLAFNAPHAPYQAPQDYIDRFKNIADPTRRTYAAMIACMDDEIGKVVAALDKKGIRDNTIIVWHSDNGGTKSKMFAGEGDVSKINLPCDNGTLNGGKGQLYEGGTRVPAFANWPGHIKPGSEIKEMIHITDMFPTLLTIGGVTEKKSKPLDGFDISTTLTDGKPTSRSELVYNIEPYTAAIREGDWKLLWKVTLPAKIELFNIAQDPDEKTNLADKYPDKVKELQARIQELSAQAAKPLFLQTAMGAMMGGIFGPAIIPGDDDTDPNEP